MTKLFGTDGIRGKALQPPLDESTVRRLGVALAMELQPKHANPDLLLAGDTRASTERLAEWLGSGFSALGGRVTWAGVLPTPAVSHLLRSGDWAAGVVISASHNPAEDNGIKVLAPSGEKLANGDEERLEQRLFQVDGMTGATLPQPDHSLADRYLQLLIASHDSDSPLSGHRVVVDTANGAASALAGPLLERLGADVTVIHHEPDGSNINHGCGATAPEQLAEAVRELGADAGLALDGDADRAVLVDERGGILDGDDILLAWARHLAARDCLPGGTVVATVMSNLGLEQALRKEGLRVVRCPVGDRSVWLAMQEHGSALGGEQSGHVICSHHAVSGDGLLTGTHLMAIAAARGCPMSRLSDLQRLPQVLLNVPVSHQQPFEELPAVSSTVDEVRRQLDERGRVLLRYSGTEPVVRIMLEGENESEIRHLADRIAETILHELA